MTRALANDGKLRKALDAALPTVVFLVVNAAASLHPALIAATAAALATVAYRAIRRTPVGHAAIGATIVAVCAAVAAITGEARGYFLPPVLIPIIAIGLCLASTLLGRPLLGLVFNRVSGGPPDWYRHRELRRLFTISTLVVAAVNVVSAVLQVLLYISNKPAALGILHIVVGPVFATISGITILLARRTNVQLQ